MAFYVHITEQCYSDARAHGFQELIENLKSSIENTQNLVGFEFFSAFSLKKKLGRNLRLVARIHLVNECSLVLFIRVLARGSNDYERILRGSPDAIISRYQPYNDREINSIIADRTQDEPLTPRPSPNDDEHKWLYNIFHDASRQETLSEDLFVLETESWVKKIKSNTFLPYLASFRGLLSRMTDLKELHTGSTESDSKYLWDHDQGIGILYFYRPDMNRLLLLEPLLSSSDDSITTTYNNRLRQAIESQNRLSDMAVRSYPLFIVLDRDAWITIQKDEEANLALSPEETRLIEDIRKTGARGGGYPLFINGRAGSGKSTMLQYLAADYINYSLRTRTDHVPLYMTYSKDLLRKARETVQGLITTNYGALLERDSRSFDKRLIERTLCSSFHVFSDLLYSLLPSNRRDTFCQVNHVSYAKFCRLWTEQFGRRREARGLSPEVCWHVIRSYIKGCVRSSRDDDLSPDEFDALPSKQRTVSPDLYERIYRDVWERWYRRLCHDDGLWDDQDLAAEVLDVGIADEVGWVAIFCDEAQDYTPIELEIIFQLSVFSKRSLSFEDFRRIPIVFAGDRLQTINPTGFRWAAVKANYHERFYAILDPHRLGRQEPIGVRELEFNYRSNQGIVRFCNLIQLVRAAVFCDPDIRPQKSWWVDESIVPVWFDVDNPETADKLCRPGLIKLIDCPEGDESTYVSGDSVLQRLEQTDDVYRDVMSPTRAKGLEFTAVVLYRFGEGAPGDVMDFLSGNIDIDDPKQRLPWEYFFNRLYVAASRAKSQLIVVESQDTIERFWRFATDHDVLGRFLSMTRDGRYWRNATAYLLPGRSGEEWEREHVDQRQHAEDFAREGVRNRDSYFLRLAALAYGNIDRDSDAKRCLAQADEFEGRHGPAGERYRESHRYDDALRCYWNGQLWRPIKELAARVREFAGRMETRAADFMITGTPSVSFLKQIASMDDKHLKSAAGDRTWNVVFARVVSPRTINRLVDSSDEILVSWDELLTIVLRFVELGGSISHSHVADIAYLAKNYQKAVELWDSGRHTDHDRYYRTKASITPFPDCIPLLGRIGDHSEVVRRWRENDLQEASVKTDVIHAVADAALELADFRLAVRMIEIRPDIGVVGKFIRKAVDLADGSAIKAAAILAARGFVRTGAWTDVVSAVDLTSIAKLGGGDDITFGGQSIPRQKEIRRAVLSAIVWEIAVSDDLAKESSAAKEPVARLLYTYFISKRSTRDIPAHVVGAAIERSGKIVDALQYYERLMEDDSNSSSVRRFATERVIRNLERHVEYFRLRGDTAEVGRRRRRLTQLRARERIGDRKLAEYPMIDKATLHDPYGSYGDDMTGAHPFWETQTLRELARSQRVQPMTDVEALFGTWPGEEDDGFELAIDELRHPKQEE